MTFNQRLKNKLFTKLRTLLSRRAFFFLWVYWGLIIYTLFIHIIFDQFRSSSFVDGLILVYFCSNFSGLLCRSGNKWWFSSYSALTLLIGKLIFYFFHVASTLLKRILAGTIPHPQASSTTLARCLLLGAACSVATSTARRGAALSEASVCQGQSFLSFRTLFLYLPRISTVTWPATSVTKNLQLLSKYLFLHCYCAVKCTQESSPGIRFPAEKSW